MFIILQEPDDFHICIAYECQIQQASRELGATTRDPIIRFLHERQ